MTIFTTKTRSFGLKLVAFLTAAVFTVSSCFPGIALAQNTVALPQINVNNALTTHFAPPILKGMILDPRNPFELDFIVDPGQERLGPEALEQEAMRMIKYFLASMTIPEKDLWVNLSPREPDRIIPNSFGQTEMGRDLLAQDYLLKQMTAAVLSPESETGGEFWRNINAAAKDLNTGGDVHLAHKIWIVPEYSKIYVNGNRVFVADSHLKVMMEDEYRKQNDIARDTRFDKILKQIEHEVNNGRHFAGLRQIFNALILATWYKSNLRSSLLTQGYSDRAKTEGLEIPDGTGKNEIYSAYLQAFKEGVYDIIKDEYDPAAQTVISRKYFTGGVDAAMIGNTIEQNEVQADSIRFVGTPEQVRVSLRGRLNTVQNDAAMISDIESRDGVTVIPATVTRFVDSESEQIEVLDEKGYPTGTTLMRSEIHQKGLWHDVSHIYMTYNGNIILQKRSQNKKQSPGKLQVSVSGHVDAGESIIASALREGVEEAGIGLDEAKLKLAGIMRKQNALDEGWNREILHAYVYELSEKEFNELNPNAEEVDSLIVLPMDMFLSELEAHPTVFSNSIRLLIEQDGDILEEIVDFSRGQNQLESMIKLGDIPGEFGLRFGRVPVTTDFYKEFESDFGLAITEFEDIAATLTRMREGSLRILHAVGVISESMRDILIVRDAQALSTLSQTEKDQFVAAMNALAESYDENLTAPRKRIMMRRLLPVELVGALSYRYGLSENFVYRSMLDHADWHSWIPRAVAVVQQIKNDVKAESFAWQIVLNQGIENAPSWVSAAKQDIALIQETIGAAEEARSIAWMIKIATGENTEAWLEARKEKAEELAEKMGGKFNAWRLLLRTDIENVDQWLADAQQLHQELYEAIGRNGPAWKILIEKKLTSVRPWLNRAKAKVAQLLDETDIPNKTLAWEVVNRTTLDRVDGWVETAQRKAAVYLERYEDIGLNKSTAWAIVARRDLEGLDRWMQDAADTVREIQPELGTYEDGGWNFAWHIVTIYGPNGAAREWLNNARPRVDQLMTEDGITAYRAWQQLLRNGNGYTEVLPDPAMMGDDAGELFRKSGLSWDEMIYNSGMAVEELIETAGFIGKQTYAPTDPDLKRFMSPIIEAAVEANSELRQSAVMGALSPHATIGFTDEHKERLLTLAREVVQKQMDEGGAINRLFSLLSEESLKAANIASSSDMNVQISLLRERREKMMRNYLRLVRLLGLQRGLFENAGDSKYFASPQLRQDINEVVIIQPVYLPIGTNAVRGTKAIQAVRNTFPQAKIKIYSIHAGLFANEPDVQAVQIPNLVDGMSGETFDDTMRWIEQHMDGNYGDLVIMHQEETPRFRNEPATRRMSKFLQMFGSTRVFMPTWFSDGFMHSAMAWDPVEQNWEMLPNGAQRENRYDQLQVNYEAYGFDIPRTPVVLNREAMRPAGRAIIERELGRSLDKPLLLINPNALVFGSLSYERYWADLIENQINNPNLEVAVLSGGQLHGQRIERIRNFMENPGALDDHIIGDVNVQELTEVISAADFMVTVQTGPGHIAEALGVPVVVWARDSYGDGHLHANTFTYKVVTLGEFLPQQEYEINFRRNYALVATLGVLDAYGADVLSAFDDPFSADGDSAMLLQSMELIGVGEAVVRFVREFSTNNPNAKYFVMYGNSTQVFARRLLETAWNKIHPDRPMKTVMLEDYGEGEFGEDGQVESRRYYMSREISGEDFDARVAWFRDQWKNQVEDPDGLTFEEAVEKGMVAYFDDHSMSGHKLKEGHFIMTAGMPKGTQVPVGAFYISTIAARELSDNGIKQVYFGNPDGRPASNLRSTPGFEGVMKMVSALNEANDYRDAGRNEEYESLRENVFRAADYIEPMILSIVDTQNMRGDFAMISERGYDSLTPGARDIVDRNLSLGLNGFERRRIAEKYFAENSTELEIEDFISILDTGTRDLAYERQFAATILGLMAGSNVEAMRALRRNSDYDYERNDHVRVDVAISLANNQDLETLLEMIRYDPSPMVRRISVDLLERIDVLDITKEEIDGNAIRSTLDRLYWIDSRWGGKDFRFDRSMDIQIDRLGSVFGNDSRLAESPLSPLARDLIRTLGNPVVKEVAMSTLIHSDEAFDREALEEILSTTESFYEEQRQAVSKIFELRERLRNNMSGDAAMLAPVEGATIERSTEGLTSDFYIAPSRTEENTMIDGFMAFMESLNGRVVEWAGGINGDETLRIRLSVNAYRDFQSTITLYPAEPERLEEHPYLQPVLNTKVNDPGVAPEGSYGQIILSPVWIDGGYSLHVQQVQPSRGFMQIGKVSQLQKEIAARPLLKRAAKALGYAEAPSRRKVRQAYTWTIPIIDHLMERSADGYAGLKPEAFYMSTPEAIGRIARAWVISAGDKFIVSETARKEYYHRPFLQNGWTQVRQPFYSPLWNTEARTFSELQGIKVGDEPISLWKRGLQTEAVTNTGPQVNFAMVENNGENALRTDVGGIDLNPQRWSLEETGDVIQFEVPAAPGFDINNTPGLIPVIINISPVTNLPLLLGQTSEEDAQELSYLAPAP